MPHQSYLYREIHEQPVVLKKLLSGERKTIASLAAAIRQRDVQVVLIAARGTSDNAGRYANYLLGALNGLPVALATPASTRSTTRPRVRNAPSSASARAARALISSASSRMHGNRAPSPRPSRPGIGLRLGCGSRDSRCMPARAFDRRYQDLH